MISNLERDREKKVPPQFSILLRWKRDSAAERIVCRAVWVYYFWRREERFLTVALELRRRETFRRLARRNSGTALQEKPYRSSNLMLFMICVKMESRFFCVLTGRGISSLGRRVKLLWRLWLIIHSCGGADSPQKVTPLIFNGTAGYLKWIVFDSGYMYRLVQNIRAQPWTKISGFMLEKLKTAESLTISLMIAMWCS